MRDKRNDRGFTLIELLIVMIILGMLAALVGPRMFGKVGKSKQKAAKAQISLFETALDTYRLDMGKYPTTEQGLAALREKPDDGDNWDGPYLARKCPLIRGGNHMHISFRVSTVIMKLFHMVRINNSTVMMRTRISSTGKVLNNDGFAKNPNSVLHCILRHCGVGELRLIPQNLFALNLEFFSLPSEFDFHGVIK